MLTHDQIWFAIDALAARQGLSASALAKKAGLDATTFNRSKRKLADGHPRWPSTESIAKILAATGTDVDAFLGLIPRPASNQPRSIPLSAGQAVPALDTEGKPTGEGWARCPAPAADVPHAFALVVGGEAGQPLYRAGDILIVSARAEMRSGDRIAMIDHAGGVSLGVLERAMIDSIAVRSFVGHARVIELASLHAVARILWASQ